MENPPTNFLSKIRAFFSWQDSQKKKKIHKNDLFVSQDASQVDLFQLLNCCHGLRLPGPQDKALRRTMQSNPLFYMPLCYLTPKCVCANKGCALATFWHYATVTKRQPTTTLKWFSQLWTPLEPESAHLFLSHQTSSAAKPYVLL